MIRQVLKKILQRSPGVNKYDFGHVLVIGGSPGMVGAPFLAAEAALRTGAGLVTVASAPPVISKIERRVKEVMTLRLLDQNTAGFIVDFIQQRHVNALVIGPGLANAAFVPELLAATALPTVLDAGGLAQFYGTPQALKQSKASLIITPHAGEFQKLTGQTPTPQTRDNITQKLADLLGAVVVLKGDHTLVAAPQQQLYHNNTGNPGLAKAGTGDVLSGVIVGLLAQGVPPFKAAAIGVYLHGLAGDMAAADKTQPGMIASDVTQFIPAALQQYKEEDHG